MEFLSDLLLAAGAIGAAAYCLVLSRRLKALTALDSSMGSAIAVLSAQVDDLTRALKQAHDAAQGTSGRLVAQTERAEASCRRLELLIASLHDLPEPRARTAQAPSPGLSPGQEAVEDDGPAPRAARILRRRRSVDAA